MTKTPTISIHGVSLFPIGLGLAVLMSAIPASAVQTQIGVGVTSDCSVINPNRFQCNFPTLAPTEPVEIQYVSMQCGSTGTTPFLLQEFQVLTTPPHSNLEVSYQIPITNQPSLGGVVSAGSPVKLHAEALSKPRALIDLVAGIDITGTTQCTVSLSAEYSR
jgi:hypothetical protein